MLLETVSTTLTKALQNGDLYQTSFTVPTVRSSQPTGDGVYIAGQGGGLAPNRVFLLPFCLGPAGSAFTMRLFGWTELRNPSGDTSTLVWIPFLLAELVCVATDLPGFAGRLLSDSERLCDAIALTKGSPGAGGFVNSSGPGTGLVASATVFLCGCRKFSFDFASGEETDVGMNCLWARA